MSKRFEEIKQRYLNDFVTDSQLKKYYMLGVLTAEEYKLIYELKHPPIISENEVIDAAE